MNLVAFKAVEAEVLLGEGNAREALGAANEAIAVRAELVGGLAQLAGCLAWGLDAAFVLGDDAKVDELLALVEGLPPGDSTPSLRAIGARFSARRAALKGDEETAAAGFAAAARIFREIEMPFELAVVLLEHAEWLTGTDGSEDVGPLVREAGEIFERLRATPYVERLRRLPVAAPATVA